jgi:hypothetical protein
MQRPRTRTQQGIGSRWLHLEGGKGQAISGFSEGEYVFLRDEKGVVWRGIALGQDETTVRFSFRNDEGVWASGVSDRNGITLRDSKGVTWRGIVA